MYHIPVLRQEAIDLLLNNKDTTVSKIYVDCTLGGGGYTEMILNRTDGSTKVIAIDRDMNAIDYSKEYLKQYSGRTVCFKDNFANIEDILNRQLPDMNKSKISGLVMDLGLSSYQLNNEEGFSYQRNTALDMRSDRDTGLTAKDILNKYSEKELLRIFKELGELKYYKQLSRDIVNYRKDKTFETTFDLVEIARQKIPRKYLNSDLSKIFQALRIEVNEELENLKKVLTGAVNFLEKGARIVVVSYHSLEDRIVKNFFRSVDGLKVITKKPVTASRSEIEDNSRSRSAKLRAAERV
jgi:16S rRNA (cytosine1402-N4)-methyltransferase